MLNPNIFKDVTPNTSGRYNHINDKYWINPGQYIPPRSFQPAQGQPFVNNLPQPQQPQIVIIERNSSSFWDYLFWSSIFDNRRHEPVYAPAPPRYDGHQDKDNENKKGQEAGLLAALVFFGMAIAIASIGIAYGAREMKHIAENIYAKRKPVANAIKFAFGLLFGIAGLQAGINMGAYYGVPLFGSAVAGSVLGGFLLATGLLSAGFIAGKYLAKLCTYIYTRGETTNSDRYTLLYSTAKAIDAQFNFPTYYPNSRANLMAGYIENKIMIAKLNKAQPDWVKTLEGFRKDLKAGKFTDPIKQYFDNEWNTVRNSWYLEKQSAGDGRYTNEKIPMIENDLKALSVITGKEETLQFDLSYFQPKASAPPAMFVPGFDAAEQQPYQQQSSAVPDQQPEYAQRPVPVYH